MVGRTAFLVVLGLALAGTAAAEEPQTAAGCEAMINQVKAKFDTLTDSEDRKIVQRRLRDAERELYKEGEIDECYDAIERAVELVAPK